MRNLGYHGQRSLQHPNLPYALGALLLLASSSVRAEDHVREETAIDDGDPRAVVSLVTSRATAPRTGTFDVGVRFELDEGWHVYFRNPGDAALGTELTFRSEGARVGPVAWPVPTRLVDTSGTIATFGYEHDVLFVAPATLEADANHAVTISVVADFLVCEVQCIPGRVTLSRTLRADTTVPSDAAARVDADDALRDRFAATRAALPRTPGGAGATVAITLTPSAIAPSGHVRASIRVTCAACPSFRFEGTRPEDIFFPDRVEGLRMRAVGLHTLGEHAAVLNVDIEASADDPGIDQELMGIVALPTSGPPLALEIAVPLPRVRAGDGTTVVPVGETRPSFVADTNPAPMPLGLVLVLAFLGGLVLNAMPCVLPVLALKVFAVARDANRDSTARRKHVAAYALGILLAFLLLASAVIALRAAGASVGWGMQLQDPRSVAVLAAGVVVFALGIFGVFSIGVDVTRLADQVDRRSGSARAFGEGVLAVVLATPCSAPFLGSAVGFALTQSNGLILAVFFVVGLGLATPFVLLALVPGASRLLPRPGAWMHVVERLLGFALLGTAAWLTWVVGTLAGVDGMARALVLAILAAFVTWAVSAASALATPSKWMTRAAITMLFVGGSVVLIRDLSVMAPSLPASGTRAAWSEDAVRTHLAAGSVVFVDFTASWCITCKANERIVLDSENVRNEFEASGVVTLVGDYTQRDARIGAVLARHRRAGVPLYLVYAPARPEAPEVLPELLTESTVIAAIERAEGGSP